MGRVLILKIIIINDVGNAAYVNGTLQANCT